MSFRFGLWLKISILVSACVFLLTGCNRQNEPTVSNTANASVNNQSVSNSAPSAPSTAMNEKQEAINLPVTLPVLDAMFADENFPAELKSKLGLSDEQIAQLKQTAHEATANLKENQTNGSTAEASQTANEKILSIIGADKADAFTKLVRERWENGGNGEKPKIAMSNANQPNAIPSDTRIVVNAPAYRMDLFKDGKLISSYRVGIGYPEFPLPSGMREASQIIFNPTWTPPDEPWVEGSKKVQAGKKVEAGSPLNPLGPIKIPIGLPSLIHGGKQVYKLGGFASHGCVGLTNPQVQDFSYALAQLSGTSLTLQDIADYGKQKSVTKNVKLSQTIPVELRYETIVVEDGTLKIFRDVYERGTNTKANLDAVLSSYGVSFDSLSKDDQAKISTALNQMAVDAGGQAITAEEVQAKAKAKKNQSKTVTRNIVGKKEIDIPLAALRGKGYPSPVNLNTGGKSAKPIDVNQAATKPQPNSNQAAQSNQMMPANKSATTNSNTASKKF